MVTGLGEDVRPLAGGLIGVVWCDLTAAPFQTFPFAFIFILSTCIGSALVPWRKSGGKSVVLGSLAVCGDCVGIGEG